MGNDTITGGHDGDLIFGGVGHDSLEGGAGVDAIDGGTAATRTSAESATTSWEAATVRIPSSVIGMLDRHDLIEGFSSEGRLDLTQLFDNLGVDAKDREGRVSLTDNGFGGVDVAVDAGGDKTNGFEHVVATLQTNCPITGRT